MPPRILIVEDEHVLAKNMQKYLSRCASDVRTAADAAQVFEILETFSPDAVIMDFRLPNIDGLRIYAEIIRRQGRKINCVIVTGNPTEQLLRDAHAIGIHHVVCKPFRFSDLPHLLQAPAAAVEDVAAVTE